MRGRVPRGTGAVLLGRHRIEPEADGQFFAGFDRDAPLRLAIGVDGEDDALRREVVLQRREWRIEHVNAAIRPPGSSETFLARRRPELERIAAARARRTGAQGWRQVFAWPAEGRISGLFGAQRIYRGEPGSYHTGLDIATPRGTPFTAPADGVVVLAAREDFTLEGKLLLIDHGQGLGSAFLHADSLAVSEGQTVRQGQVLGTVGASGRASGPHLHWGLTWNGERLDPLLFVPPR
ncbi:M23 family metallopeptidase [Erythrobacteraceae bacterium CFH 75059]|nr:M23 family metallopeptidase [Erythrobacteraceae bacterium CFH 75059]